MTKARTVADKKRAKRGRPKAEGVEREPSGRAQRPRREPMTSVRRVALEARCRILGWEPTGANLKAAEADHLGFSAGRAIHGLPDAADLWQAARAIWQAYHRYYAVLGLPAPYPPAPALMVPPDRLESDGAEVSSYDDRSLDERVRTATSRMMHIEGVLGCVTGHGGVVASEVKRVVLRDETVRHTPALLAGLRAVSCDLKSGS